MTGDQPLYDENDEENKGKDNPWKMRTGKGRLLSLGDDTLLFHDCDDLPGFSGGPIYSDLIFEGKHYYTVVGINTFYNKQGKYNGGVRMCPNIINLVRSNSK